jgi:uncharacterized membrane protein YccC
MMQAMSGIAPSTDEPLLQRGSPPDARRLENALRAAGPPLLFGLRLWASVSLALYAAFWLQLDAPYWAAASAAIVCQPQLGASLRKGWFRMIGTLIGAAMSVLLTASFPQDRLLFLFSLALWGAACAVAATLLRNFASYAAALAGYTAAIVAGGLLGLIGGLDADAAFLLAVTRATEICLGIACAGVVLALTDFGGARRRLAALVGAVSSDIAGGFIATLGSAGDRFEDTLSFRRELVRRVIALDPVIDQAFGESSELRYYSPVLQRAVDGLYVALGAWRTASVLLSQLPHEQAQEVADKVLQQAPAELCADGGADWLTRPVALRRSANRAARQLTTMPADTPPLRLLADKSATAFAGLSRALDALALLMADPTRRAPRHPGIRRLNIPDWLPAVVNGGRTFVTIASMALFWIVTAWPGGSQAIVFAAIVSVLMAPRAELAYATALISVIGVVFNVVLAAIVAFAVLPGLGVETFAGLSLVLAACLVPLGTLLVGAREPWQVGMFGVMTMTFMLLLAPTNLMNYDVATFYNTSLGIVVGAGAGTLAFRLIPPLSPGYRTRRLLSLALGDLRRLFRRRIPSTVDAWDARGISRLSSLPDSAAPLQRARLLAAILIGAEIIRLRRGARRFGLDAQLDAVLADLARGDVPGANDGLAQLDQHLTARQTAAAVRARARILMISGALAQHAAYFELLAAA